jgi:hypothetical protein
MESMTARQLSARWQLGVGIAALVFAAALAGAWLYFVPARNSPLGSALMHEPDPATIVIPRGLSRRQFYETRLAPLLERARAENHRSADRAIARLHEEFERFRAEILDFADDVTSWGTRFGILARLTNDRWKNTWRAGDDPVSQEVKTYMLDKFEAHVMSRLALQRAVDSALRQFKDDVTAGRNRLLLETEIALSTSAVGLDFPKPDFEEFQRGFDAHVASCAEAQGAESLQNGVVTFVGSTAAAIAAERLAAQIVGVLATQAVAAGLEAAAAGSSSAASGGALGAAAGWLGGPGGEVIGVAVGLVVGIAVDWWMTDQFKARLARELTLYLDNLERDMVDGVAAIAGRPEQIGLRRALHEAADSLHAIQGKAAFKALEEAK